MSLKEPIAIVGMGCRFPGAKSLQEFWQLLLDGKDVIQEIPAERFDIDAIYDPTPGLAGKLITRWGGFLADIDQFDPYFFGISPREAARMDPQQRLLLEVAWEALEDAGIPAENLVGSATGVFVGMSTNDYEDLAFQNKESIDLYMMTGCSRGVASGRLSYILDLQGPSMTIDTACSSSLVAVHLACQSIWSGECSLALAGGTNLILGPEQGLGFSKMGLLAPDGRCKTFDARADGFVRSEGVGTVVLKPLSQALADRDPIYCVIRGSAVNNDGRTSGLLVTPGLKSQEDVLRKAYLDAGVAPEQVQYVETHGTGTIVGDRVEVTAIGKVCGATRPKDQPCLIGSVKTNIGHSEGAAGMAGLLKVALSLKHGIIPPNLHLQQPHPQLPLEELNLQIPQEIASWRKDGRLALAGVSSFGISATNAHMVLEQAPSSIQVSSSRDSQAAQPQAHILTLSAQTSEALTALAQAYQDHFGPRAGDAAITLSDISYTANCRRSQHSQRLALVAHSKDEMLEQLAAFVQGEDRQGVVAGTAPSQTPKIAFVFPGQGSQWLGMGRELLQQEPIFRQTLEQCESLMRPYVDWSLLAILTSVDDAELLNRIDIVQPTLFSIELALAALWRSWGIQPDAVVGHSMGELAAAVVAGALSAQDAMQVICQRSLLLKRVAGKGCMAVVELSLPEAQKLLIGYEEQVSIATSNGPKTTVLAGDRATVEILMQKLQKQKIYCSLIRVDVASHSAQMDVLLPELQQALLNLQPQEATIAFYSTVTANPLDSSMQLDAGYWAQNIRQPVLFYPTIKRLLEDGYHIFLEISPHPILMGAIKETLQAETRTGTALPSLRRAMPERATLLETLGHLYTYGANIDFNQFYVESGQCIPVPTYPWQRERFWLTEQDSRPTQPAKRRHVSTRPGSASGHPMLGPWMTLAARPDEYCWEFDLDCDTFAYLRDHRVQDNAILPATAYLELALAAAREVFGAGSYPLEHVAFKKALFLPEDSVQHMQLIIAPEMPGSVSFQLFSLQGERVSTQSQWELHAQGRLLLRQESQHAAEAMPTKLEQLQAQSSHAMAGDAHYQQMSAIGLQYGPAFRGVERIWQTDGEALCQIAITADIASHIDGYQFHPALFDACLQAVLAALPPHILADEEANGPIVPIQIEHMQLYQPIHTGLWSYAHMSLGQPEQSNQFELSWEIFNQEGQRVLEACGVRLQRLGAEVRPGAQPEEAEITDWLYEIQWKNESSDEERLAGTVAAHQREKGSWLILADRLGVAQQVAEFLHTSGDNVIFAYPGDTFQELIPLAHYQLNPARPGEFQQLLQAVCGANLPPCHGILHFWSLETQSSDGIDLAMLAEAELLGCGSTLHLLQAIEQISWQQLPRLWLITNGVQATDQDNPAISVAQSPLWGLGRTIVYEHPELRCARVDLGADIRPAEIQSLFQLIYNDDHEDQIALRGQQRYVARLSKVDPASLNTVPVTYSFERSNPLLNNAQPCRIDIPTPGSLDNLCLSPAGRTKPGPGEVEIQVSAAGLNFKDVLFALGMLDYQDGAVHFGLECAGRISALGEGVEGLRIGDDVIAVSSPDCFNRFVIKPAIFVVPKPRHLSFEEAATTSIVFLTAYYALIHVGHLMKGERVLIHAASGGVGLAAVQIAQKIGAEIFATAGSPEKREFLRSLGIQHIMDSRSLSFADEIMELTHGQGIDIVLNSLAGEALTRSFGLLANHGRFLELGKKDIQLNSRLNLAPFEKSLSFSAIDISLLLRERPQLVMPMLREILQQFEARTFTPLPTRTFPLAETIDAFRWLAQARQIGKVAISFEPVAAEKTVPTVSERRLFNASSTYLITGGLGGLGLTVVQWMVEQGARHVVLVGRSRPSESAWNILDELKRRDVDVVVAQADITDRPQVVRVLDQIKATMPPLRGILHAAAILKDSILLQTSVERLQEVMAPKILGAWNLHCLTADLPLDFFVCFSSTASLIGLPGQGNYSAANAFLDALAHYRQAQGLAALSINWGAWSEVGLAAAQANRGARLAQRGIKNISPQHGLAALELLLWNDKAQVGAMPFDVVQWQQFYPSVSNSAMFASLLADREDNVEIVDSAHVQKKLAVSVLQAQTLDERKQLVQSYLQEHIARILRIPIAKLDSQRQLHTLGIDSLMAVELKNQIEADTEITVPVVLLLQGTSIRELANYLLTEFVSKAEQTEQWTASEEGALLH